MTAAAHDPLSVLVVDDDHHLLRTLADILRRHGYAPRTATRGSEGLAAAETAEPPAIALVDLKLPDMDGMEVVSRLRARSAATEIVVLTGNASIESAVGALRQHSFDYLIKPVAPDQLLVALGRAAERWLRRRAEEALSSSEERFRWLIESIGDVVFLLDADLRVAYVSPSIERVLGRDAEAVLGRTILELFDPPDPSDGGGTVGQRLEQAMTVPVEMSSHGHRGQRFLQVSVNDLRDNPSLRGLVLTARDITGQRKLEQQAMQAHRLDSVGRLAGGVAHDFNNILCVVLGATEMAMSEPDLPARVRAQLGAVKLAGEKAAKLTGQLLQFARRQPGEPRVLDLRSLVADLLPILRRLIAASVDITIDVGDAPVLVEADPTQLEQILLNLVVNARDAMPDGGRLVVTTRTVSLQGELALRHAHARPGAFVLLAVQDTGTGMSEEVRSRAMEPFFTTKEPGSGTGLGLSICYGIVRQAHGSLALQSAPGRGTLVEVLLPAAGASVPASPLPEGDERLPRGRETILVAEDDAGIRALVVGMLERLGYKVLTATDGEEALKRLLRLTQPVHLLLSDVVMPRLGGPELVATLRRRRPDVKVLLMSGYPRRRHDGEPALGLPLLAKPFTASGLAHAVRAVLDGGAAAGEGLAGAT